MNEARAAHGLYGAEEALRDALSSPWQYVGTGAWPGINRMRACVYRNARVFVVDVYCTLTETQAVRVDVYSPTRGRVRVYAEANGPISGYTRPQYFTFTAQSEPPPAANSGLAPLTLGMSQEELRAYDERRYDAFLPVCYGGIEHAKPVGGCLGALQSHAPEWTSQHRGFLEQASADWYQLLRDMRTFAALHGREPE